MTPFQIFIGYDPAEAVAFHVLSHSLHRRSTVPLSITPIMRDQLSSVFNRPRAANESTEFSITRFLTPYLSGFTGYSLFIDCDMLCLGNVVDIFQEIVKQPGKSVWVVQHEEYVPKSNVKFLGAVQSAYPRKNWSSVMLFDNERCKQLTTKYVEGATGLELHRFQWLKDEEIGSLPLEWNWLVGEYEPNPNAKMLHFTLGGPWFGYEDVGGLWQKELNSFIQSRRMELVG